MDKEKQTSLENEMIPGRLIKYMIFFWIASVNVGIYFAFLFHNRPGGMSSLVLVILFFLSLIGCIWSGIALVRFYKESVTGGAGQTEEEEVPEIV